MNGNARPRLPGSVLAVAMVALGALAASSAPVGIPSVAASSGAVTVTTLVAAVGVLIAQWVPWTIPSTRRTTLPQVLGPALVPLLWHVHAFPRPGEPWPLELLAFSLEEYLAISTAVACYSESRTGRVEMVKLLSFVLMIVAGSSRSTRQAPLSGLYPYFAAMFMVAAVAAMREQIPLGIDLAASWGGPRPSRPNNGPRVRLLPPAVVACLIGAGGAGLGVAAAVLPFLRLLGVLTSGLPADASPVAMPDAPRLGALESLQGSVRPVMRFVCARPALLRVGVAITYQGGQWSPTPAVKADGEPDNRRFVFRPTSLDAEVTRALGPGRENENEVGFRGGPPASVHVRGYGDLTMLVDLSNHIPCPLAPVAISLRHALPTMDGYGLLTPSWRGAEFRLVWGSGPVADPRMKPLETTPARFLQIPADLRRALRPLAQSIASVPAEARLNPERACVRIAEWLQRQTYAAGQQAPEGRDPVEWFACERRRGHCEYFASAMALMLRSLGIPTRYVWGFQVVEATSESSAWIVRERDAHAWVEALLPGRGWTEWDPTPSTERDATHLEPGTTALERGLAHLASVLRALRAGVWGWSWRALLGRFAAVGMGVAACGALFALGVRLYRRRRGDGGLPRGRSSAVSDSRLPRLFGEFERWLAARGVRRSPTEAPGELADRLMRAPLAEQEQKQCAEFLAVYGRARYGEEPLETALVDCWTRLRDDSVSS